MEAESVRDDDCAGADFYARMHAQKGAELRSGVVGRAAEDGGDGGVLPGVSAVLLPLCAGYKYMREWMNIWTGQSDHFRFGANASSLLT